eukprot:TRINITY_DN9721_c0_g1_i12.p1 TRINITY_DN9721_c0_g1~~TRINITY_DN9721_c0_g1_i12.p1  ORF type:complete len:107 (-),score=26.20 TRINITY_DN9721_c0_g1_i12:282-560(-)
MTENLDEIIDDFSPETDAEIKEEEEMDLDEFYICLECQPIRILRGAEGLVEHGVNMVDHSDIKPLWSYNQVRVNLINVMKRKSTITSLIEPK